jgi:CBS-domain-containing membrane protein
MKIIDKKVRRNLSNYVFQCLLATATLLVALLFLNVITETALIASLGATAFIVFAMPNTYASSPRRLIGGYSIGINIGIICFYMGSLLHNSPVLLSFALNDFPVVFAAVAVGLSIFIMAITNTEHALAAGIALGIVINQWNYSSIVFIILVMLTMSGLHHILKPALINLTSPKLHSLTEKI